MKKKIVCCSIMVISLLLCSCTSQNPEKTGKAEVIAENNEKEQGIAENTELESTNNKKTEVEFISVERFMEIYKLSSEDIGDFNLQGMITEDQVTEENIDDYDWKARLEYYIAEDINCGYNVAQMVLGNGRQANAEDDITSVKWLVMDNVDGMYTETFIWDLDGKKSYFAGFDMLYDYSKADIIKELTEEQINHMTSELVAMNMPEWKSFYDGSIADEEVYNWNLYVVLENGDVLLYSGYQPEISAPEGFNDWLQEVIRVSKGE